MSIFPFALIPAAGRSRRMGTPKLLLDVGGRTVVARLLRALEQSGVANRLVVIHPDDKALAAEVEQNGGRLVVPAVAPPDMLASVRHGLSAIDITLKQSSESPGPDSPWLLIPADHPVVLAETVRDLLNTADANPGRIIVPTFQGRRGHPTVFAWKHAIQVAQIPKDEGFNWILKNSARDVVEIAVASEGVLLDLDTPNDYERLRGIWT